MSGGCEILSLERYERLLRRELPRNERELLRAHLAHPCEDCLDLLASVEGRQLVEALGAQAAELSAEESERMLARLLPLKEEAPSRWEALRRALSVRWVLPAMGTALAVWVGLWGAWQPAGIERRGGQPGLKSAAPAASGLEVQLLPILGHYEDGSPRVVRALGPDETLAPGELLLFRYRLSAPAFVYLLGQGELSQGGQLLWGPAAEATPTPAGEHEVATEDQVLALDPTLLGENIRLMVLAVPERLTPEQLLSLEVLEERAVRERFPGAALHEVSFRGAQP